LAKFFDRSRLRGAAEECASSMARAEWVPPADIRENGKEYVIKAELPGLGKGDIRVAVENGALVISGERKSEPEEKDVTWYRVERFYGSFVRSFILPDDVDAARIGAEFKDGVLELRLPRAQKIKPGNIEVNVA
jgi:HSP20 family protein